MTRFLWRRSLLILLLLLLLVLRWAVSKICYFSKINGGDDGVDDLYYSPDCYCIRHYCCLHHFSSYHHYHCRFQELAEKKKGRRRYRRWSWRWRLRWFSPCFRVSNVMLLRTMIPMNLVPTISSNSCDCLVRRFHFLVFFMVVIQYYVVIIL